MRPLPVARSLKRLALTFLCGTLLLASLLKAQEPPAIRVLTAEGSGFLSAVAFSPDGRTLLAWDMNGFFRWDLDSGRVEHQNLLKSFCQAHGLNDWPSPPSSDGRHMGVRCGQFELWNAATAARSMTYSGTDLPFSTFALSPDGAWLATAGRPYGSSGDAVTPEDKTVHLRNAKTGAIVSVLTGHTEKVTGVGFSANNQVLATASSGETRLWNVRDGSLIRAVKGASSFAFSPDGRSLAVDYRGSVLIYDVLSGEQRGDLDRKGLPRAINGILFSPDGRTLAVAGGVFWESGKTATLWTVATMTLAQSFPIPNTTGPVAMAFSPDSRLFAVVSNGKGLVGVATVGAAPPVSGAPGATARPPVPPPAIPPPAKPAPPSAPPPVAAPTTDLDAILKRGGEAFNAKRFDDAVKAYQGAIALQPANADFRFNLGISLTNLGQWIEADRAYTEAIRLQPAHAQAYYQRGQARYFEGADRAATAPGGRFVTAIFDLVNAQSLDGTVEVRVLRAFAYLAAGETDSALTDARNYLAAPGWRATQSQYMALVGYLAARQARHENDAKAMLADCAVKCDVTAWPYPIIRFLRGELTGAALMALATDADKMTEARAYRGMDALLSGRTQDAIPDLRWVSEQGNKRFYEWPLATARLRDVASASTPSGPVPASPAPATVTFGGIGAEVQIFDRKVRVNSIVPNSPAARAGLHVDDIVAKVDGKPTAGLTIDQIVAMVRGPVGSAVTLTIQIPGATGDRSVTLKRESITAAAPPESVPPDTPTAKPAAPAPPPVVAASVDPRNIPRDVTAREMGITLAVRDGRLVVYGVDLCDSAANLEWIEDGDKILRIDGQSAMGLSVDAAKRLLQGREGTTLVLSLGEEKDPEDVSLIRRNTINPDCKVDEQVWEWAVVNRINKLMVTGTWVDGPADKAGIEADDQIVRINGRNVSGMSVATALALLDPKSDNKVTILPDFATKTKDVILRVKRLD